MSHKLTVWSVLTRRLTVCPGHHSPSLTPTPGQENICRQKILHFSNIFANSSSFKNMKIRWLKSPIKSSEFFVSILLGFYLNFLRVLSDFRDLLETQRKYFDNSQRFIQALFKWLNPHLYRGRVSTLSKCCFTGKMNIKMWAECVEEWPVLAR